LVMLLTCVCPTATSRAPYPAVPTPIAAVDSYLQELSEPLLRVAFGPGRADIVRDLDVFATGRAPYSFDVDPSEDVREHGHLGPMSAAAGFQRGGATSKHGLPQLLPEGPTPLQRWESAQLALPRFGCPAQCRAHLARDAAVAVALGAAMGDQAADCLRSRLVALHCARVAVNLDSGASLDFRLTGAGIYVDELERTAVPSASEERDTPVLLLSLRDVATSTAEPFRTRSATDSTFGRER